MRSRHGGDEWSYRADPAFGLKLTGPGEPRLPRPTQLGLRWLRLDRAEQARRRRAFFRALLAPWIGAATFHARGLDAAAVARLTALDGVEAAAGPDGGPPVVSGPLTDGALEALLAADATAIAVRRDARPLLAARDGWLAATVHLTEAEERAALTRIRALPPPDGPDGRDGGGGRDRRGRALALLAVHYALLAVALAVGWLALRQLGDAFPTALAVALALAVAATAFSLLAPLLRVATRWYGPG